MRRLLPLAALAAALGGCGGGAGDLMLVRRDGSLPAARLELRFTADGRVACNGGSLRDLASPDVLESRNIARALTGEEGAPGPAAAGLRLPRGPYALLRYEVRLDAGAVRFWDSGAPPLLGRLIRLVRGVATRTCKLAR